MASVGNESETCAVGKIILNGQKSGLAVSVLSSGLEDCGFESHPMLDRNGVKAKPGSITAPNPGSLIIEQKENKVGQMGHTKKI